MGRPNPIADAGIALFKFGDSAWDLAVSGSDAALEAMGFDWIEDRELDPEKIITDGVRAAGPLTGIPSNQMLTTGEYLYDVGTGQYAGQPSRGRLPDVPPTQGRAVIDRPAPQKRGFLFLEPMHP